MSSVLGAILVFGLFVITLVVVQVKFVPVWQEDREASLMQEVTTQLGQVKSDLDRQVDNRTGVAIANPLTLQRSEGFRFFSGVQVPGEAAFVPSATGAGLTIDSQRLTILQSGDQSFLGLADDDDWIAVDNSEDVLEDVTLVRALRLRIDMDEDVCGTYDTNDFAALVLEDADGDEVGRATATWLQPSSGEWALKLDIFTNFDGGATADDQISSDTEFFFQQLCVGGQENFLDYHYFDLLDPALLFDAVLESADGPFTLSIDEEGLVASYVIVYDAVSAGGGSTTFGSLGLVIEPYNPAPFPAGSLVLDANNQRYPDQTYVLQHGALLRVQDGVAAMAIPPNFEVSQSPTQTSISWAIPSLSGSSGALTGSESATIVTKPSDERLDIQATCPDLSIVIPTEYPRAWYDFLDRELRDAGMDAATQYSLPVPAAGATSVSLTITGVSNLNAVDDLYLRLRQTDIALELRSSG